MFCGFVFGLDVELVDLYLSIFVVLGFSFVLMVLVYYLLLVCFADFVLFVVLGWGFCMVKLVGFVAFDFVWFGL